MARDRMDDDESGFSIGTAFKIGAWVVGGVLAASTVLDGFTVLGPNQVACFRTFGNPDCGPEIQVEVDGRMEKSHQYYGQGLHLKLPWVTTADVIQISSRLTDVHTAKLTLGAQNQPAEVDYQQMINIPMHGMHRHDGTYVDSPYYLLYQVGNVGSTDVNGIVDRFVDAGLNKAFAPIEPDNFSSQRDTILKTVTGSVAVDLAQIGVEMGSDIKITRSELQGAWKEAANARVISIGQRNAAVNYAEATRLKGQGLGESELAEATGHAKAMVMKADADASYIAKMRAAFGGNDNALAVYMMTQSHTAFPQVLGEGGVQIVRNVPAGPR